MNGQLPRPLGGISEKVEIQKQLQRLRDGYDRLTGLLNMHAPSVFNVMGYGARGDGLTDDTVAIQRAIVAAEAVYGGTVYFPPGKYLVSSTLVIRGPGLRFYGAGMSGKTLSVDTVEGGAQIIGTTASMTVMKCSGVDNDGTTFMQAGPVFEGIAFVDAGGQEDLLPGTMTLLELRVCNRWHIRNCGFFFGDVGLKASKDTTGGATADCAQWTIYGSTFTFCGIGAWLNTFTGSIHTSWANGCEIGYLVEDDAVAQVVSGVGIYGCKFDIREPTEFPGYTDGIGIQIGNGQNITVAECLFETQPGDIDAFTTTGILVDGNTSSTRVNIENCFLSNLNTGIDVPTARFVRINNVIGRTGSGDGALVVDSMVSLDTVTDAVIMGTRSEAVVNPVIKLTTNTANCVVIGHSGSTVNGTTNVADATPVQVWKAGVIRATVTDVGNVMGTGGLDISGALSTISHSAFPPLAVVRTGSATNTVGSGLVVQHNSTADMVDGFGAGLVARILDSAAVANIIGSLQWVRDSADTSGSLIVTLNSTQSERARFATGGGLHIGTTYTAPPAGGVQAEGHIITEAYYRDSISSPAQITGNQDNYNPGTAGWLRLSTDASRNITGFTGGAEGRQLTVTNIGAQNIVLVEQATSTAANQIITGTGADITLAPLDTAVLKYDSTSSRWRVISAY